MEEIVGTGASFLNPSTNLAEIAYMVVPEWQGSGLGAALQQRLKEFAMDRGVRGFVAELLQANMAMLNSPSGLAILRSRPRTTCTTSPCYSRKWVPCSFCHLAHESGG